MTRTPDFAAIAARANANGIMITPAGVAEIAVLLANPAGTLNHDAPIPCGGCGETTPAHRCIGCQHDFGTLAAPSDDNARFQRLALSSAGQAAAATAELLEAAQSGPLGAHGPFTAEPVELLTDATKLAIEAARAAGECDEERDQLHAALCQYLNGWQ